MRPQSIALFITPCQFLEAGIAPKSLQPWISTYDLQQLPWAWGTNLLPQLLLKASKGMIVVSKRCIDCCFFPQVEVTLCLVAAEFQAFGTASKCGIHIRRKDRPFTKDLAPS